MIEGKLLLGGEWLEIDGGDALSVENPATGELVGRVPAVSRKQLEHCSRAAAEQFRDWASRAPAERGAYLREASRIIGDRAEQIARLMTSEQGKPLKEALGEVRKGANILRYYAEEGERVYGRIVPNDAPGIESQVRYEPVGVAAGISPWNYPIELLAWKIGGALAAGCPLIAKVPSLTPLSPLAFIAAVADAGVPPGVLSGVAGSARLIGDTFIADPVVKKIAFTGSTEVGKSILQAAAGRMKKISLELGGSLPMVVCADCDLEAAVRGAVYRSFRNMGQICIAINRIYVQRAVYEEFVQRFAEGSERLTVGNGLTDDCDLGPMATIEGLERAENHIADAVERGARLVCGGYRPKEPGPPGLFFRPAVLADVTHEMAVMQEETFGPVAAVMPFDSPEEAARLSNDNPYGLAAIVFTRDLGTAEYLANRIEAGNVGINTVDTGVINAPYGGWKDSGSGYEHGPEGLYEYLRAKHVRIRYDGGKRLQ